MVDEEQAQYPPPPAKKSNWLLPVLLGAAALVIAVGVLIAVLVLTDDDSTSPTISGPDTNTPGDSPSGIDALFAPIDGFTFLSAPELGDDFRNQMKSVPGLDKVVVDEDGKRVLQDGENVAVVIAVEFAKDVPDDSEVASGFSTGATSGADTIEKVSVEGQEATYFERDGTRGYSFVVNGFGVLIIGGADQSTLKHLASGMISNAGGRG